MSASASAEPPGGPGPPHKEAAANLVNARYRRLGFIATRAGLPVADLAATADFLQQLAPAALVSRVRALHTTAVVTQLCDGDYEQESSRHFQQLAPHPGRRDALRA